MNIVSVTNAIVDSFLTILSTGGLCCIWVMCWFVLARDSPEDHPRITQAEKNYIVKNIEFDTTKRVILYCFISMIDNDYPVYVVNNKMKYNY